MEKQEIKAVDIQIKPNLSFHIMSIVTMMLSLLPLGLGFHKMFVYNNTEGIYLDEAKNAYVGGDAWNYVINGTYSIAFFVLFAALLVAGLLIELVVRTGRVK